jgi:hypothetical protein
MKRIFFIFRPESETIMINNHIGSWVTVKNILLINST